LGIKGSYRRLVVGIIIFGILGRGLVIGIIVFKVFEGYLRVGEVGSITFQL
jgi:hypothetical protein